MSHFRVYKQDRSRKSSPFSPLKSHNFRWFRAPSLKCVKTQMFVPFLVFLYGLLDPVLNRVRNYSTFSLIGYHNLHLLCLELGQGFLSRPNPPSKIPVEYTPRGHLFRAKYQLPPEFRYGYTGGRIVELQQPEENGGCGVSRESERGFPARSLFYIVICNTVACGPTLRHGHIMMLIYCWGFG